MNAPEYIRAIWEGDAEEAVRQIYRTNPFAHVCGRVCTHRCEDACSVGRRGAPMAIRWLKRYAMDSVSDERVRQIAAEGKVDYFSGMKIALIGAGPAGLTAAYDLARKGHEVRVFEALDKGGGMVRFGIPEYRLPYDRLDADIEAIQAVGVTIQYNTRVGKDLSMTYLRDNYDAVLLAIGMQQGRSTRIPGSDHPHVGKAIELLRRVTCNEPFYVPHSAVVIGGGNVAMDIARSLARLQKNMHGAVKVTVCALEDFAHFLADEEEVAEAREEGIDVLDARGPVRCVIDENGHLTGLVTHRVVSIFDEAGRFAPRYDETDECAHVADSVIEAIGQAADISLLGDELTETLQWNRGRLAVDDQGRTSEHWLWACGDMVRGPDVVHAVADGHRVAASIESYLTTLQGERT